MHNRKLPTEETSLPRKKTKEEFKAHIGALGKNELELALKLYTTPYEQKLIKTQLIYVLIHPLLEKFTESVIKALAKALFFKKVEPNGQLFEITISSKNHVLLNQRKLIFIANQITQSKEESLVKVAKDIIDALITEKKLANAAQRPNNTKKPDNNPDECKSDSSEISEEPKKFEENKKSNDTRKFVFYLSAALFPKTAAEIERQQTPPTNLQPDSDFRFDMKQLENARKLKK